MQSGGAVCDSLFTKEGLLRYLRLPKLDKLHGNLVSILNTPATKANSLLGSHQHKLSNNLEQYVSNGSELLGTSDITKS